MPDYLCMKEETKLLLEQGIKAGNLYSCRDQISQAFRVLCDCYESKNKILVCGNGGSAADSEHIIGELMKGFRKERHIAASDRTRIMNLFHEDGKHLSDMLQQAIPAISLVSQV